MAALPLPSTLNIRCRPLLTDRDLKTGITIMSTHPMTSVSFLEVTP